MTDQRIAGLRAAARDLTGKLGLQAFRGRRDFAAVEAVIETALAELGPTGCNDPVLFASVLRECLEPTRYATVPARGSPGDDGFSLLLQVLEDPPVVAQPIAFELARAADSLTARTDSLSGRIDVGFAALRQSTFGRKGRLLTTIARVIRPRSVLELGTAFGMSAAFLARAAPAARIVTLEPSAEHVPIARELLRSADAENVEVLELRSEDGAEAVGERLGTIDLLFHDAHHSREAYVRDFETYEPLLAPGALVLYDDIDFRYAAGPDTRTRAGWEEVTRHARVRSAAEIDDLYGLLEVD